MAGQLDSGSGSNGNSSGRCSARALPRIRKGQKIDEALAPLQALPPSVQYIESPFQLQEYLSLLLRQDPHDVDRIVSLPEADVSRMLAEERSSQMGKGKDANLAGGVPAQLVDEELHPIDTDVWVFEQLRRIVLDLSTPWLTSLQHDCSKTKNPSTCDAMNAGEWMYLCASHGEEKQCCAIDYTIHTLDGATALLNSARHFPSRTYIPTTSLRHFGSISRRLSRIFVHAKDHHRKIFDECESETSLYARFYALCKLYDLISIDSLPSPCTLAAASESSSRAWSKASGSAPTNESFTMGRETKEKGGEGEQKQITLLQRPQPHVAASEEEGAADTATAEAAATRGARVQRTDTMTSRKLQEGGITGASGGENEKTSAEEPERVQGEHASAPAAADVDAPSGPEEQDTGGPVAGDASA
ncbi:Mob1/phocein [Tilletiaria anomala UBC 951]|uniref:Mob1/phocein n=1 Tax=Tilletiaria anomala (strain ATCC 24038 / CBS 436.72 / UBC 951) TaxID=1037660 RepID=A0A066VR77_TILAU|nr:Mob1/phocein [Tilletiaria anomala UBC 951]KDN44247.1 Mob1/phocein [Tilletiaria anomala UBC 951]